MAASLQTDNFHPIVAVLKKNISGSIDGEAIQKDMTGAKGTPPNNKLAITGITPQEQKGLNAPSMVANNMDTNGFLLSALLMIFDTFVNLTSTARGMEMTR